MPKSDQGISVAKYQVIPRTLIFIRRGDRVLLLKGSPRKRLWANLYNGIGGHIERGEDVYSSACRELAEETGLVCANLWICGTVMVDAGQTTGVAIFILRGEYESGNLIESVEGSLEWVEITRLNSFPLVEDLKVILPRILAMKPGDPPFSAVYTYNDEDRLQIRFGNE